MVPTAWVPVCVERSRSCASVALAVAADAMPSSFALSVADMSPLAELVAAEVPA
jgi:hypothetical protein